MIVFKWLKHWFDANEERLKKQSISFSFSNIRTDISKPSQVVDIEKNESFAQIILWNSGECDIGFLERTSDEIKWFDYQIVKSEKELNTRIENLFSIF